MKKIFKYKIALILLITQIQLNAQSSNLLVNIHEVSTTDMNALAPLEAGMLVFNTDSNAICYYNGSAWRSVVEGVIDSIAIVNDSLRIYEGSQTMSTPISSSEWEDADKIGMSDFIYAKQALANGDTVVFTDQGQLIMGTTSTYNQNFIFIKRDDAENIGASITISNPGSGTRKYSLFTTHTDSSTMYIGSHGPGRTLNRLGRTVANRNEIVSINGEGLSIGTRNDAPLEFGTNDKLRMHINENGNVGIGWNKDSIPTHNLDVDGKVRVRTLNSATVEDSLVMADKMGVLKQMPVSGLISTDANNGLSIGTDGALYKSKNKSYVYTYKTTKTYTNGNAQLLNLFPQVTIQPNKDVYFKLYVPTRSNTTSWGGLYVNVNVNVNGTWYNLGNTGYDGGVMASSALNIHALNHEMLLDFITNIGLPVDQPYTVQFELTARSYNGTTTVNGSHDINRTSNSLGSRGAVQTWASDQNYTHIIIIEKDR